MQLLGRVGADTALGLDVLQLLRRGVVAAAAHPHPSLPRELTRETSVAAAHEVVLRLIFPSERVLSCAWGKMMFSLLFGFPCVF